MLRYPGGKAKIAAEITQRLLKKNHTHYREPMVGGGSVALYIRENYPNVQIWINDQDEDVYAFWKACQENCQKVAELATFWKERTPAGQFLYAYLKEKEPKTITERAAQFFVLNRISFSGLGKQGGYSEQAFQKRFNDRAIARILPLQQLLEGVKITHGDYAPVLLEEGESCAIFIDPPYASNGKANLYKGHLSFDHYRLADTIGRCKHDWLLTYDDCPTVQYLYKRYRREPMKLQYSMNSSKEGDELFISPR